MDSYPIHDPRNPQHEAIRRKVVSKIDLHTLPGLSLLWLACFIDRTNVGNAQVAGMGADLGLHGKQFNTGLAVFYVTYIASELPSNFMLKRFGAKLWLPLLVFCWGIVTVFSAFMTNFTSLVLVRLFLGLCEGGLLPGMVLYLSTLYKKEELQLRVGVFFASASLSGAFGGLLAYQIDKMDGVGGKPAWAWIFILEGLATIVVAIFAWWYLPSSVASARFLNPTERAFAANRLKIPYDSYKESDSLKTSEAEEAKTFPALVHEAEPFEWGEVRRGFLDVQVWLTGFGYMSLLVGMYSYSFFLPSIVKGMGYKGAEAQLFSSYPYLPASALVVAVAFFADKYRVRAPIVLALLPLTVVGYLLAIFGDDTRVRYGGVFLMAAGLYPCIPCILCILPNNTSGITKRATVTALQLMVANCAGFIAAYAYQAPHFVKGHWIALSFACLAWLLIAANAIYCWRENVARMAGRRNYLALEYYDLLSNQKTRAPLGDRDPTFMFTI